VIRCARLRKRRSNRRVGRAPCCLPARRRRRRKKLSARFQKIVIIALRPPSSEKHPHPPNSTAELGILEAADSLAALRPTLDAPAANLPPRRKLTAEELAERREARYRKRQAALACVRRSRRHRSDGGAEEDQEHQQQQQGDGDAEDPHAGLMDVLGGAAALGPPGDPSDPASSQSAAARAAQAAFDAARCSSHNRGSIYHSAGVSCHFCRQKKLCGEPGCPRCSRRAVHADCLGKSECPRCQGARGRFCRGCLWARYGEDLDDVRRRAARGEWVCYHCQEEEAPESGIVCNSSICMVRRGMKPTGAAADEARARGYRSVCHWVQAGLLARRARVAEAGAGAGEARPASGRSQEQAPEVADAPAARRTSARSRRE
jgi:hypothetical protein